MYNKNFNLLQSLHRHLAVNPIQDGGRECTKMYELVLKQSNFLVLTFCRSGVKYQDHT